MGNRKDALDNIRLFSLNSNRPLAEKVSKHLGIPLGDVTINTFSDGEIAINIEESIRGKHIYLLQSTHQPINDYYMEIFIMADACRRASAQSINLIMPYYGYARQDRKAKSREPVTAKVVANALERCGVDHVVAVDLHAPQIQGFFECPLDHLTAQPILANYFSNHYLNAQGQTVVVSPNHSAATIGRQYAQILDLPMAIIDDRKNDDGKKILNPIGHIEGLQCVIVDDLTDTGVTLSQVADALTARGALEVYALVTHPVLSKDATQKIEQSSLKKLVTTDTILLREEQKSHKIEQVSIAHLLADAVRRIHEKRSIKPLYQADYMSDYEEEMF